MSKDSDAIWSITAGSFLRGVLSRGGSIKRLTLDGDDPDADDLGDGVGATGLMRDFHVVPGLDWGIDGYGDAARCSSSGWASSPARASSSCPTTGAATTASARDLKGTDRMTLVRKLRALKPPPS